MGDHLSEVDDEKLLKLNGIYILEENEILDGKPFWKKIVNKREWEKNKSGEMNKMELTENIITPILYLRWNRNLRHWCITSFKYDNMEQFWPNICYKYPCNYRFHFKFSYRVGGESAK